MYYLVTGGFGAFGYHILKALEAEGDTCSIYDRLSDWGFMEDYEHPTNIRKTYNAMQVSFSQALITTRPDVVIHCAERTCPDISMSEQIMNDNVLFTVQVLQLCSRAGIRCIIPAWKEFETSRSDSFWATSLAWKTELSHFFNIGNAVNNVIFLPRLIGPYFMETTFGNVVKRVYNSTIGVTSIAYEHEFQKKKISWIDTDEAANRVIDESKRRSRVNCYVDGHEATAMQVAQQTVIKTSKLTGIVRDEVQLLSERGDSLTIKAIQVKVKLEPAIEKSITLWERNLP